MRKKRQGVSLDKPSPLRLLDMNDPPRLCQISPPCLHKSLITEDSKSRIEQYICGIASNNDCKPLSIYCNPDHTHLLLSMKPKVSCSETVQKIKSGVSLFINKNRLLPGHFEWQTGFGAFSYGKSQVDAVCRYIQNQKEHHRQVAFRKEYLSLLEAFGVEYDE